MTDLILMLEIDNKQISWYPKFQAVEDKLAQIVGLKIEAGLIELEIQPLLMDNWLVRFRTFSWLAFRINPDESGLRRARPALRSNGKNCKG